MTEAIISVRDSIRAFKDEVVEFDNKVHGSLILETVRRCIYPPPTRPDYGQFDHTVDLLERFVLDDVLDQPTRDSLASTAKRLLRIAKARSDTAASGSRNRTAQGTREIEDSTIGAARRKRAPSGTQPMAKRRTGGQQQGLSSRPPYTAYHKSNDNQSLDKVDRFWSGVSQTYRWNREFKLLVFDGHLLPSHADLLTLYAFTLVESRTAHQTTAMAISRAIESPNSLPSIFSLDPSTGSQRVQEFQSSQMTAQQTGRDIPNSQLSNSDRPRPEHALADLAIQDDLLDLSSSILAIRRRVVQYRAYCVRKTLLENVAAELDRPVTSSLVKERANKLIYDQYSQQYTVRFGQSPGPELITRLYTRLRNMTLRGQKWALLVDAADGDPWALTLLCHPNIPDSRLTNLSLRDWGLIIEITERVSPLRLGQSRSYMAVLSERMREVVKGKVGSSQSSSSPGVDDSFLWSHISLGWVQDSEDELSQDEGGMYSRVSDDTNGRSREKGRSVRFQSSTQVASSEEEEEDDDEEDEEMMDEDIPTQSTIL